jgi:tetratricopeptide (TPR) repeat protein
LEAANGFYSTVRIPKAERHDGKHIDHHLSSKIETGKLAEMDTTALNFMLLGEKNHALMPRPARNFKACLQQLKSANPVLSESEWVHFVVGLRNAAMAHRTSSRMPTAEYEASCAQIKLFLEAFGLKDLLQDFEAAQHNLDFGQLEELNRRWQEQFEVVETANQEHFELIEKANATTHAKLDKLQQVAQELTAAKIVCSAPVPVPPPLACHNLRTRDSGFIGREQTLSELDAVLSNDGAAVAVVGLSGIGGVGKTHLAQEYGHQWLDGDTATLTGDPRSVVWVDSEGSRAQYRMSFATAVEEVFELAPLSNAGSGNAELNKRVARASKVVASAPGCLLILDNVDSEGAITEMVPARRLCRVLATTRIDILQGTSKTLRIDVLDEDDALQLLWSTGVEVAHSAEEQAAAKKLVERLGRLTLALAVASRLLSVRGGPTPSELLEEVEAAGALVWSTEAEECAGGRDYIFEKPTSLSLLFDTSFTRLEANGKHGQLAMQLALVLGFVAPVHVPRELVVAIISQLSMGTADSGAAVGGGGSPVAPNTFGSVGSIHDLFDRPMECSPPSSPVGSGGSPKMPVASAEHDQVRLTAKVLPRLAELNLVQVGADGGVTAHRLLAEYFRHCASDDDRGQVYWCTLAACAATQAMQGVDAEQAKRHTEWPRVRQLCEHAGAVAEYMLALSQGSTIRYDQTLRVLLHTTGSCYRHGNNNQMAVRAFTELLTIQEREYGPDHMEVANTLTSLGNAYGDLGDHAKKRELLERALVIEEREYGPDHREVARTLVELGKAYGDLGDHAKKKELLERALVINEREYGPDHREVARTLANLGNVYGDLGDLAKQKELLERALVIKEREYGPDHREVAKTIANLGSAYGVLGEYAKKKELLERALVIHEREYGPDHWAVAINLFNLGEVYGNLGDAAKQQELLERALAIFVAENQHGMLLVVKGMHT